MIVWTSAAPSVLASFMASTVEFVEALTIVLAVGVVRGWRSALLGTAAALAVLVGLVAVLGPSLTRIPLPMVQLVVGTLLLLFGLRWLRKAILRSAGVLALHDEAKAFAEKTAALRAQGAQGGVARQVIDKLAFATAFKIVMLEGIEVVFIVIAIGASLDRCLAGAAGRGAARPVAAPAAGTRAGERAEVRRRCDAGRVRDFLGRRRYWARVARCRLGNPCLDRRLSDGRTRTGAGVHSTAQGVCGRVQGSRQGRFGRRRQTGRARRDRQRIVRALLR